VYFSLWLPYNIRLTNLACSSRTREYWTSIVFVRTSLRSPRSIRCSYYRSYHCCSYCCCPYYCYFYCNLHFCYYYSITTLDNTSSVSKVASKIKLPHPTFLQICSKDFYKIDKRTTVAENSPCHQVTLNNLPINWKKFCCSTSCCKNKLKMCSRIWHLEHLGSFYTYKSKCILFKGIRSFHSP